jgi:MFS family permease
MLFVTRMMVGADEAGMAPCVHGIIGDSFPRDAMAKPLALQGIGFQVGSAIGVAAAGAILAAASGGSFAGVPLLGEMTGWRTRQCNQ